MMKSVSEILADIWASVGGDPVALADVNLTGHEPGLPSSFRVGAAAQATIAALGLAAARLHQRRTGLHQTVTVAMDHAVAEFQSERYIAVDGIVEKGFRDPLAGIYPTKGGGWFRPHISFPHHKRQLTQLLELPEQPEPQAFAKAISNWDAFELQEALITIGGVGAALQNFEEWDALPQAKSAAEAPLIRIERIGDGPRDTRLNGGSQPLSGVKVLDLTRVIAGPVCGRAFAAYGAQVLAISSPKLPSIPQLVLDTNRGKLSTHIDLDVPQQSTRLKELLSEADIFLQGYRPHSLEQRGFGPLDVAKQRPGIVYVQLSAYGRDGPWADRRGFDSLVQTATGFNDAEMRAVGSDHPQELPCQVLDHATGQLMALGALVALDRRAEEGGSWLVEVSLASTAHWLRGLGRLEHDLRKNPPQPAAEFYCYQRLHDGRLVGGIAPAATLSLTPPQLTKARLGLGSDQPHWL